MGHGWTQMNTDEQTLNLLTEKIIGCVYRVANVLGAGFLEKVYENALTHELRKNGLAVVQQQPITVRYDGVVVREYLADLIVEEKVIVELKAIKAMEAIHAAQCINYLAATAMPVCLLVNFSTRVEIKRLVGQAMPQPKSP
jgi:GxxExxY protein